MPKISLCLIVKASDAEAKLLDRCLKSVKGLFDEICITITGENKKCEYVAKKHKAKVSHFTWINDFSAARNFNFSHATGEYIMWLDADDILKGGEFLADTLAQMEKGHVDVGVINYLYDFDNYGRCTVKHLKTRIIKNDGCVKWVGKLHEDFQEQRQLTSYLIEDIEVIHTQTNEGADESAKRNAKIALQEAQSNPDDPRSLWLVANALMAQNKRLEASEKYKEFIEESGSDEEKYLAYMYLSDIHQDEDYALQALKLRPTYPNAYHKVAEIIEKKGKRDQAINFIEIGLQLPVPEMEIIVHNPRDYDYNPLMLLMKIHFELGHVDKSMKILETLIAAYPKDQILIEKQKYLQAQLGEMTKISEYLDKAEELEGEDLKKYLDNLPQAVREHPKVCAIYNTNFIKQTSSGKDLVYYCGFTTKAWNPEIAETEGVGGSEEAVINLAKRWAKLGWNVTVYNNCGKTDQIYEGVAYKHWWEWNYRDSQDVVILWRHPRPVDYGINAKKIFIDLHDVIPPAEFTKERVKKIDKIFVKTNAHRILFPEVADDKFAIIPNGIEVEQFEHNVKKNPYLILNTSSPDRHLDATLDTFEELIRRQPEKPWKLAWYYGWGVYDTMHKNNKEMMSYKDKCMKRFNKLVAEGRAEGGRMIGHHEIAKKYLEAGMFFYPTQFTEIHCISAAKAQIAGCKMVTSDWAALKETVNPIHGYVHTEGEKWGKENTFGDTENKEKYLEKLIDGNSSDSREWAEETFNWEKISKTWNKQMSA